MILPLQDSFSLMPLKEIVCKFYPIIEYVDVGPGGCEMPNSSACFPQPDTILSASSCESLQEGSTKTGTNLVGWMHLSVHVILDLRW